MLVLICPGCQSRMKLKPKLAGTQIRCPKCQHAIDVPAAPADEPHEEEVPHALPANEEPAPTAPTAGLNLNTSSPAPVRRKKRGGALGLWIVVVLGLVVVGGAVWYTLPKDAGDSVTTQDVPEQHAVEGKLLKVNIPISAAGGADIKLVESPAGSTFDKELQQFQWTPGEEDGPGTQKVVLRVTQGTSTIEVRFSISVEEADAPPVFSSVEEFLASPETETKLTVQAKDPDTPAVEVTFHLVNPGVDLTDAKLDSKTGVLTWTPPEVTAGETVQIVIAAKESSEAGLETQQTLRVRVAPYDDPVRQLLADFRKRSLDITTVESSTLKLPFTGKQTSLKVGDDPLEVFAYESDDALQKDVSQIDESGQLVFGKAWTEKNPLRVLRRGTLLVAFTGDRETDVDILKRVLDESVAVVRPVETPMPEVKETPALVQALKPFYEERATQPGKPRKLFTTDSYAAVRKAFADEFEKKNEIEIKAAFGTDYDEVQEWFSTRTDMKEELYTAIIPGQDDVVGALKLFNEIRKAYPKAMDKYGQLAIAVSVVWDNGRGVYGYTHHADRTHSTVPKDKLLHGMDNFAFFVEAESAMQGRAQFLPWEFMVHMVDHKTPLQERLWAVQNYSNARTMYGKCYSDVPYDTVMLQTSSKVCKLGGMEYNLPNILQFGGVCAMQADYAARVGKSVGIPAAYVGGEARSGDLHAWVMWVELQSVTQRGIVFSLQSHGRYQDDHYYVGTLEDPQTGRGTTDRRLELKLHQVGTDAMAARHSRRVMELYPALAEELNLDFEQRLEFLSGVVGMNPWSEPAWKAVSQIPVGRTFDKAQYKLMNGLLNQLFVNFARFPDFTITVFDDLISFEPEAAKRIGFYYQLLDVYATAGRPDLSFKALLRLSELLEEENRSPEAIQVLAAAIQKYATEGQHIPNMLDRLEALASSSGASAQTLADFYQGFLPNIPKTRAGAPSAYCIKMYERAIPIFQQAGYTQLAQNYQAAALQLKASGPQ
ncbi:MAG: hypothetical protein KDA88_09105 [Planctomycetaceae bacterium]|nr:hypothetical protein [Planctomycetaceae bacterium]MCB9953200.1 hypothetical protein [Planctomycetaceae bacterium]